MQKPLSLWDRIVFGMIASLFGIALALVACLSLFLTFRSSVPMLSIVLASVGYFFIVGAVRGADAALFTGEALTAVAQAAMVETGAVVNMGSPGSRWATWSSPVLVVGWVALIGVLAWRG